MPMPGALMTETQVDSSVLPLIWVVCSCPLAVPVALLWLPSTLKLQSSQRQLLLLHTIAIKLNQAHGWWLDNSQRKPDIKHKSPDSDTYTYCGATTTGTIFYSTFNIRDLWLRERNFINFRLMSAMCAISLHFESRQQLPCLSYANLAQTVTVLA